MHARIEQWSFLKVTDSCFGSLNSAGALAIRLSLRIPSVLNTDNDLIYRRPLEVASRRHRLRNPREMISFVYCARKLVCWAHYGI
jgi:hypothetical protein